MPNDVLVKVDEVANTMLNENDKPIGRTTVISLIFKHLHKEYIQDVMRSYGFKIVDVDRFIQNGGNDDQTASQMQTVQG